MHKKGFSLAAALVAMLSACSLASAQEIYFGAAAGNLKTQGILDTCGRIEALGFGTSLTITNTSPPVTITTNNTYAVSSCPNSVSSMRLRGGLQANDNFSVEGFYAFTQDMDFKASYVHERSQILPVTLHISGDLEYHTYGLVVNGRVELLPDVVPGFYGFARAGLHMWEQSAKINSTSTSTNLPRVPGDEMRNMLQGDGSDLIIGGGFQYLFSDRATLEVGYEDLNGDVFADTTSYYLGASYSF